MKRLMLGNEAIAWGAMAAGVRIAASYPGTPSSEIGETFAKYGGKYGVYFEWSVNEKVALEVACAGSYHGQRSIVSMKGLGLNVASDTLNVINFGGVGGGLVIVSSDDPGAHSSTNEQDCRWHAIMATLPLLEPSDVQESYELTKKAFEVSETFDVPVIMRTVTRLAHTRSYIEMEEIVPQYKSADFVPRLSYRRSDKVWDKVEGARRLCASMKSVEEYFCSAFNAIEEHDSDLGIICCGMSYLYAMEALKLLGLLGKMSVLRLVSSFPIPKDLVGKFCKNKRKILVLEELSPFVEMQVRTLVKNVNGKMDGFMRLGGELGPDDVAEIIERFSGKEPPEKDKRKNISDAASKLLIPRTLTVCPGCAYRDIWYVLEREASARFVFSGDIGCYTLLTFPPYRLLDTVFAMGSSTGFASGVYHANENEIPIAVIGDSTFFHSGIAGLINAVYNKSRIILVILDNGTTAMTGFEPHPGTGITALGEKTKKILPEEIAAACGVDFVEVVYPFDLKRFEFAFKRALVADGVSVVVARHPCILKRTLQERKEECEKVIFYVNEDCRGCGWCENYRCPAIIFEGKRPKIAEEVCTGCGVCSYLCPFFAIVERNRNE